MRHRFSGFGRAGAAVLTVIAAGACGSESPTTGWRSIVDTSGSVVRVVNTAPSDGAGPTMTAEVELRVGTVEGNGPDAFGRIRSVAVLEDGRFAVADAQAEEVRLFDRNGRHLVTFGGKGEGPGELMGMQGVHTDHQGLLRVAEQGNARLSVFHADSGFVTSYPLRLFSYSFAGPWSAAIDEVGRTMVASSGQYGEGRFWNMLRVYDRTMTQVDSIPYDEYTDDAEDEEPEGAWRITLARGWTYAQIPFYAFYARPYAVLTSTGEFWSTSSGAGQLEIARWTPPGDTSLIVISERATLPVTRSERDSAMTALRASLSEWVTDVPALDPSRVPGSKPPLYGLALDDHGRVWALITDFDADTTVYDVFGPEGRHSESVVLRFPVDQWIPPVIRGDTVWAVSTDDLDVQYVVRARLRRPVT